MNQDKNEAAQEFMDEIVDDLGYGPKGAKNQGSGSKRDQRPITKYLLLGGGGILLLIVGMAFFLIGRGGKPVDDLTEIQKRMDRLEERMLAMNGLEERIAGLEVSKGLKGLHDRISRLEKEARQLQQEVKHIAGRNPAAAAKETAVEVKPRHHTVRSGESLYTIGRKYGLSTDELCKLNHITPKQPIQPGQKLLVSK